MVLGPPTTIPALTINIPLDDQRASLVAQLITEADSVIRLSLQEQISLLDARKAEDELLASKVPDLEVLSSKGTSVRGMTQSGQQ